MEFDVIDDNAFANATAATWYAGYHSGKEHPQSDSQHAFPERIDNATPTLSDSETEVDAFARGEDAEFDSEVRLRYRRATIRTWVTSDE